MHAYHVKYEILTQSFLRQLRAKCAGGVKMNGPKNHSFGADEEYANQIILGNINDNSHYYDSLGNDKDEDIYSASLVASSKLEALAKHVIGRVCGSAS